MTEGTLNGIIPRLEAEIERLRVAIKAAMNSIEECDDGAYLILKTALGNEQSVDVGKVGPAAGQATTGCIDPKAPVYDPSVQNLHPGNRPRR